jgi:hypothetical protein
MNDFDVLVPGCLEREVACVKCDQDFSTAADGRGDVMEPWHTQAVHHFTQVTDLIHESLYEFFADASVDLDIAAAA